MAKLYNYNGFILPHIRCTDNDLLEEATILWRADGTYRFANSGYMATSQVYNHDPVSDMIYAQHGTHDVYELQDGAWVRLSDLDFGIDTPVFPASDVLYCNAEIETRKIDYLYPFGTATYWPADEPGVLVSDDNYTLEATYSGGEDYAFGGLIVGPGVAAWGATGVFVGAQIRDNNTDEVTDISDKATYSIYSVGAGYAYLDGSRQIIVAADCPLNSIGMEITWSELPGQTATLTVYKTSDPGGEGGGGGTDPGGGGVDTSGVTDIQVSMYPEEVAPGGHAIFEVLVVGEGNYSSEYTLELNGQESEDTYVVEGRGLGNIWVAEDETADFVLLTVTSVENPLIQTSEMLYINQDAVIEPEATAEQLQRSYMQGMATAKAYFGKLKIVEGTVVSVDQTNTAENPEDIPSQLRRAYWQGFLSGVGSLAGKGEVEGPDVPSVEDLQKKYAFTYYSTMNKAVGDVNGGTIGANEDATKDTAVAGVYTDENGGANVVLLKDHTEAARIQPSVDMTINLGGHKLTSNDWNVIDILSGNTIIDGTIKGSTIYSSHESQSPKTIQNRSGNITINGGSYIVYANNENFDIAAILSIANLSISDAVVTVSGCGKTTRGIAIQGNLVSKISNCEFTVTATSGEASAVYTNKATCDIDSCNITACTNDASGASAIAVLNQGIGTISKCSIKAFSKYNYDGNTYTAYSYGVYNSGTLTIDDCYVMGTLSGLSNRGHLYVNGGTYEGYGHGGFYFDRGTTNAYVQNATIRECAMPDGYTDGGAGSNHAGFYIGGISEANNITVYMDNCDIYGKNQPIVLRGSSGEKNNSLYISNSMVNDAKIRIDNNTHRLYIGSGNNFTAEDTTLPEAVVVTNEVYVKGE